VGSTAGRTFEQDVAGELAMNKSRATMLSGIRMSLNLAAAVFIAAFGVCVLAEDPVPTDDVAKPRASLTQAVADAQEHFDSLTTKESLEAIDAMQAVIACKRELLSQLVKQDKVEDAEMIRTEVRSLARSVAWVATLREKKQEYEKARSEWTGLADSCKQAIGINSPEYWDAAQEANAMARMATAEASTIQAYLANRSEITKAVGQKDLETAQSLALKGYEQCCELFGELVPRTIASREYAAMVAFSRKQFPQSFELFEDANEQRSKLYPAWHPTLAKSILDLGTRYESAGLLENAESTFRRTGPSVQQWSCMVRLGTKHRAAGQNEHALRLLDEVFTECVETIGENHPLRGLAGTQSGEIRRSLGDYQQALDRLNMSAQIWKANSNTVELANCVNSIALAQQLSGEHDAAESSYLEAARMLADENKGRGLELRMATESNYASLLEETGRFPEALKIYEKIVSEKVAEATVSPADLTVRENLARLYQSVGELAKAETLFDSLLQYGQRQPVDIARLHSLRGRFFLQMDALDKADSELDAALTYLNSANSNTPGDVATVQSLKALVLLERGESSGALTKYEEVLKSLIESFGPNHVRCAEIYDQIAKVQRTLGNYPAATEAHLKSIEIYETAYGATHETVAWAHHRLGTTHFVFNSPDDACIAWRRSFEIKQDICHKTLPWLPEAQATAFLTSLTTNDSSAGRDTLLSTLSVDKARNADEAFFCVWRSRGLVLNAIANRERQLANTTRSPDRAQLEKIRRRLAQLSIHGGSEDSAHRAARAQMLRDLNDEKEAFERIIAERAQSELSSSGADGQLDDVTPIHLMSRLPPQAALVQLVKTERWQPTEQGATDVAKKMVYDAFVVTRKIDAAGSTDDSDDQDNYPLDVHWIELGDAAEIDNHIATWRKAILSGDGGTRGKRLGKKDSQPDAKGAESSRNALHERVWKPISSALGSRSRFVLVPDGDFHRMPWVALPGTESDYLIEEVQITTAADGRQLAQLLQQQQSLDRLAKEAANSNTRSDDFLLIGGVDYNAQLAKPDGAQTSHARETTWSFLKGTQAEIAAIGQVLPTEKTRQLMGEHALEEAVKSEFEKASVIHIATHGYFADDIDEDLTNGSARGEALGPRQTASTLSARNPLLQCGLTLAGCNCDVWLDAQGLPLDNGQDGYLSAEEIMGMDLGRTRLVVLSACETGLGNIGSGEGVFGLQRALHISGVKSTIASGWKVDDRATELLMTEMYRQMFDEGLSAADALHTAQIRVLRQFNRTTGQLEQGNSQAAPPYYWAAFSLSGAL
jgi:CHAT domain-containing protein/tetratricopeptide (TPR) repeat protein